MLYSTDVVDRHQVEAPLLELLLLLDHHHTLSSRASFGAFERTTNKTTTAAADNNLTKNKITSNKPSKQNHVSRPSSSDPEQQRG